MKWAERFPTIFLVAGIGFFLLSFVGMGLAPWTTLKRVLPKAGLVERTALETAGREVFMREGCWHCHSQFVRPVAGESLRYGPVSSAMEHANEVPQLFGTRRVGPDLAREAGRRTDDWHFAHFYNPRATAPWSIMPAFPWLYAEEHGAIVPTERAKALVAYMQSLGKGVQEQMEREEERIARGVRVGTPPTLSPALLERGAELFSSRCAGCHGAHGDGNGQAKPFLVPAAADLTRVRSTPEYVFGVLNRGIRGSSMPHFRDSPVMDLWGLAYFVQQLSEYHVDAAVTPPTAQDVAKGKATFQTVCAVCHGEQGHGDGVAGAALRPAPPDFHGLRPSVDAIVRTLAEGVPGTAMAAFPQLRPEEKRGLAHYIQTLITANEVQP